MQKTALQPSERLYLQLNIQAQLTQSIVSQTDGATCSLLKNTVITRALQCQTLGCEHFTMSGYIAVDSRNEVVLNHAWILLLKLLSTLCSFNSQAVSETLHSYVRNYCSNNKITHGFFGGTARSTTLPATGILLTTLQWLYPGESVRVVSRIVRESDKIARDYTNARRSTPRLRACKITEATFSSECLLVAK